MGKRGPARLVGKRGPQLMLMMLGVGAACGKKRPSDAGAWVRLVEKRGPADAHDAGRGCGLWEKAAQLMLVTLGVGAACGKKRPS